MLALVEAFASVFVRDIGVVPFPGFGVKVVLALYKCFGRTASLAAVLCRL